MPGRIPPTARLALPTVLAALASPGTAAADLPPCPPNGTDRSAIVCEINAARADAGRKPVRSRPSLADAARGHSRDMVDRRYFAHDSPDGEGPGDRARRAGYVRHADSWRVGEVLAWSRGEELTAAAVVDLWLGSPSHRRILLSSRFRDVGAGPVAGAPVGNPAVEPATTITVVFGHRAQ
jgi:uncharacterized protein YkwD